MGSSVPEGPKDRQPIIPPPPGTEQVPGGEEARVPPASQEQWNALGGVGLRLAMGEVQERSIQGQPEPTGKGSGVEGAEGSRGWARGQVQEALKKLRELLENPNDPGRLDPEKARRLLSPTYRRYLLVFTSEMGHDDVNAAGLLGVEESSVRSYRRRVLEQALKNDKGRTESVRILTDPIFIPRGSMLEGRWRAPEGGVGPRLMEKLRKLYPGRLSAGIKEKAKELGISESALRRFLSGQRHPHPEKVLDPLLRFLGIAEEEAQLLKEDYNRERVEKALRKAAKKKRTQEERSGIVREV